MDRPAKKERPAPALPGAYDVAMLRTPGDVSMLAARLVKDVLEGKISPKDSKAISRGAARALRKIERRSLATRP